MAYAVYVCVDGCGCWLKNSRLAHCKSARPRTSVAQHCGVPSRPVQTGLDWRLAVVNSVGMAIVRVARAREREAAIVVVKCIVSGLEG